MNKKELEMLNNRLNKEIKVLLSNVNILQKRINHLKNHLETDSSLFRNGLADNSEYNKGCMNFLNHYMEVCNKLFNFNLEPIINTKVFTIKFSEEDDNYEN